MLVKVIKAFSYAHDHVNLVPLVAGQIVDIDEGVVEGLFIEKFIDEATAEEIEAAQSGAVVVPAPVEIPDDWRDLKWFQLQALARRLGAGASVNKATATALIEAELAARG